MPEPTTRTDTGSRGAALATTRSPASPRRQPPAPPRRGPLPRSCGSRRTPRTKARHRHPRREATRAISRVRAPSALHTHPSHAPISHATLVRADGIAPSVAQPCPTVQAARARLARPFLVGTGAVCCSTAAVSCTADWLCSTYCSIYGCHLCCALLLTGAALLRDCRYWAQRWPARRPR